MSEQGKKSTGPIKLTPDAAGQMLRAGDLIRVEASKPELDGVAEGLITSEKKAWQAFFDKDIDVPPPPQELFDTLEKAKELGITAFEPHYLPKITFKQDDLYPGWETRPNSKFWNTVAEDASGMSPGSLSGKWILIDSTPMPVFSDGHQMYANDFLTTLIGALRRNDRIPSFPGIPEGSRFSISKFDLYSVVLPEVRRLLDVPKTLINVRIPRAIEFNVLGNMHHPEWGETDTSEWFETGVRQDMPVTHTIIGGRKDRAYQPSGLGNFATWESDRPASGIGFRPMIIFPAES